MKNFKRFASSVICEAVCFQTCWKQMLSLLVKYGL